MRRIDVIKKRKGRVPKVDLSQLAYADLRAMASARGLFRVGMKKADLIEALNHDSSQ